MDQYDLWARTLASSLIDWVRSPTLSGQVIRFGVVGGLGFLLDAAILKALTHFGLGPAFARAISLAATVTFTWLLNRNLTFASNAEPSFGEFWQYVLSSLIALVLNYGVYLAMVTIGSPLLVGLAFGTIAGATFNFVRYRKLLSNSRPEPSPTVPGSEA